MVGEIRDFETGEIVIKAALTGHLVLSTLHTNDAPATVSDCSTWVLNLSGIIGQPYLYAASCPYWDCREPIEVPAQTLIELGVKPEDLPNFKPEMGSAVN